MESRVQDLVISCTNSHWRLRIAAWIKRELQDKADLVAVQGGVNVFLNARSRPYLLQHVDIARRLHGVTRVHLWHDTDSRLPSRSLHADPCEAAQAIIRKRFPTLTVIPHNVGFDISESAEAQDLVVSCIDYRFRALIADWIRRQIGNNADLMAVAGAAKDFISHEWRQYLLEQVKAARSVRRVHLLNHRDCGAYGGSSKHPTLAEERQFHFDQCAVAERFLLDQSPELRVKLYFVDFHSVRPAEDTSSVPLNAHQLRQLAPV